MNMIIKQKKSNRTGISKSLLNFEIGLKETLKQRARNIRERSFKINDYGNIGQQVQCKPDSILKMLTNVTNRRKQQLRKQKMKNKKLENSIINPSLILGKSEIKDHFSFQQIIQIDGQQQNNNGLEKSKTMSSQPQILMQSSFNFNLCTKINFPSRNKKFSMTNYSQRIRKGSNVSRQTTSQNFYKEGRSISKISRAKIKTQVEMTNGFQQFHPVGNIIEKLQSNRYLQTKNQEKRKHSVRQEEEQEPLKQIYNKIKMNRKDSNLVKLRTSRNMKKMYSSYKMHSQMQKDFKQYESDKKIKVLLTTTNVTSLVRPQQDSARQEGASPIGPWPQLNF